MRQILYLSLFLIIFPLGLHAQNELDVLSFAWLELDNTAQKKGYTKYDMNGDKCALIRVITPENGFEVKKTNPDEWYFVNREFEEPYNELWVYIPHRYNKISLYHKKLGTLNNYRFPFRLEAGKTYELVIDNGTGYYATVLDDCTAKHVYGNSEPLDIYVDGKVIGKSPRMNHYFTYGKHHILAKNSGITMETEINYNKESIEKKPEAIIFQRTENSENVSIITSSGEVYSTTTTSIRETAVPAKKSGNLNTMQKERCIALIIGNDDYSKRLSNPCKDAQALSKKLISLNYVVVCKLNLDKDKMEQAIVDFCNKAKGYDVALFYYAGHAIQKKGTNYLIPARPEKLLNESDARRKYVELPFIIESMEESKIKSRIIILDACRDSGGDYALSRSDSKGLAKITDIPLGNLIAFSTQPEEEALDGSGMEHSPYMTALLEELDVPGRNISEILENVRDKVREITNNAQLPVFYNNLGKRIVLNKIFIKR